MMQFDVMTVTLPIPFHRLLKVVAMARTANIIVPGERWDERARPMRDYFLVFEESFNRFPGFNYEVQGVYQEQVDGRIKFYTYAVRQ